MLLLLLVLLLLLLLLLAQLLLQLNVDLLHVLNVLHLLLLCPLAHWRCCNERMGVPARFSCMRMRWRWWDGDCLQAHVLSPLCSRAEVDFAWRAIAPRAPACRHAFLLCIW